jgi:hypothetical protein
MTRDHPFLRPVGDFSFMVQYARRAPVWFHGSPRWLSCSDHFQKASRPFRSTASFYGLTRTTFDPKNWLPTELRPGNACDLSVHALGGRQSICTFTSNIKRLADNTGAFKRKCQLCATQQEHYSYSFGHSTNHHQTRYSHWHGLRHSTAFAL